MTLQHVPALTSAQDAAAVIREHGYVIVDKLVPDALLDRFEEECRPYFQEARYGDCEATGRLTRRVGSLIARSPAFREMVLNDFINATAREVVTAASAVQLSLAETIFLSPGSPAQFIHQDEMAFDMFPFGRHEVQMSTILALTDFTEEMGATRLIPGSHLLGEGQQFEQADTVAAEMKRGSVLLYSAKIYHGSGANRSDKVRKALNVNYSAAWLRQEENQYLSCPPDIARTLPRELLELMGYRCTGGSGWIGDRMDPLGAILDEFKETPITHVEAAE